MKYKVQNGHIMESKTYPEVVTYSFEFDGPEGIYYSEETTGSGVYPYIKQIKINRIVNNGQMTIEIREASEQELLNYIEENKNQENIN